VVKAIGDIGSERGFPVLERAIQDKSDDVRHQAVLSLGRIGGVKALEILGKDEVVHGSEWVACDGVKAVKAIGGPASIPVLKKFVFARRSGTARHWAMIALARRAPRAEAVDTLLQAMEKFGGWGDCRVIAEALGIAGGDKALEGLEKLLKRFPPTKSPYTGHWSVRRSVAEALGGADMNRRKVKELLLVLLNDTGGNSHGTREAAARQLGRFKDADVRRALERRLAVERRGGVKRAIRKALEQIKKK